MSYSSNKAIRAKAATAHMIGNINKQVPICPTCFTPLQIVSVTFAAQARQDDLGSTLIHNRVDVSCRCPQCDKPSTIIAMPKSKNGVLEFYHET